MRILLVNDYGAPVGGAEYQILGLKNSLIKRGHDARLFSSNAYPDSNLADYTCTGTTSSFRTILQSCNLSARRQLGKVLHEFRPDVVHVALFLTQLSPSILPLLKNVPSVYYAAWYRAVCPTGTKMLPDGNRCNVSYGWICKKNGCVPFRDIGLLLLQMRRWKSNRSVFRKIIANSNSVRQELLQGGINPVDVIPPGVPEQNQRPPLDNPPSAAFAGRLVFEKGLDVLLHAFAKVQQKLPPARLLIAGDGPDCAKFMKLAEDLKVNAQFLGHLDRNRLEAEISGSWVQVVPSRWAEPFGLVAAEAMMRGTAVVCSKIGALQELVKDGESGLLFTSQDSSSLADALLTLLSDRNRCEQMGQNARRTALDELNEELFADRMLAVYQQLISGNSST